MEKEIELYGMTLAQLDIEVEIAKSAEVDEYVKTIKWSPDTDDYTKTLIIGNIRGFAFRKTTPETPINGFINKLAQRFAERSVREARLVEALDEIVNPIKAMQTRLEADERLDGVMAVQISNNAEYLKQIAAKALAEYRGEKANTEEKHDNG